MIDREIVERGGATKKKEEHPSPSLSIILSTAPNPSMASIRANARKVVCIGRNYAFVSHPYTIRFVQLYS